MSLAPPPRSGAPAFAPAVAIRGRPAPGCRTTRTVTTAPAGAPPDRASPDGFPGQAGLRAGPSAPLRRSPPGQGGAVVGRRPQPARAEAAGRERSRPRAGKRLARGARRQPSPGGPCRDGSATGSTAGPPPGAPTLPGASFLLPNFNITLPRHAETLPGGSRPAGLGTVLRHDPVIMPWGEPGRRRARGGGISFLGRGARGIGNRDGPWTPPGQSGTTAAAAPVKTDVWMLRR